MMWDYIVIGAGSAGCAVTDPLVNAGKSVLVLEAGGSDGSLLIKVPALVLQADVRFDWGYHAQPDPSRHNHCETWTRGKVLGGSSSINGTVYVRGAAEDFDRWSAHCHNRGGWSAREVMALFREMEKSDQTSPWRGRAGRVHVKTVRKAHPITAAFIESGCAAGYPFNPDYNGSSQEGMSYVQLTQRRGLRWSAADAFLKPLRRRQNLQLALNAMVERIEIKNGRATAVSYVQRGRQLRASARDIILCAGAINSPKVLLLSGVGDPEELRKHGIDVAVHSPGVGRNLKDHPFLRLMYRVKTPTYNLTEGIFQKLGIAINFLRNGEGPIANLWEGAAFVKSLPSLPSPDLQLLFVPMGFLKRPNGDWQLAPYPSVMAAAAYSYPASTGRVRLASTQVSDPPRIEYSMLSEQADVDALIRSVAVIRQIMRSGPLSKLIEDEFVPGQSVDDPATLEEFVRATSAICFHTLGTCRMGAGEDAVVGPDLRVKGTENLWIADASIMPDPISANINAACMMIGRKLGQQLLASPSRPGQSVP
jgi:choline dehydrogenase